MANRGYALKDTNGVTSVRVGDNSDAASADNVGTTRYRVSGTVAYYEVSIQSGASTYEWKVVSTNDWTA